MKVCHITTLPPVKSGISKYATELIQSMKNQNIQQFVVSTGKVCPVDLCNFRYFNLGKVINWIRAMAPDLIHYQFGASYKKYFVLLLANLLSTQFETVHIATIHDIPLTSLIWINKSRLLSKNIWKGLIRGFEQQILCRLDRLIVHSGLAKELLIRNYGVDGCHINIVPHGLTTHYYNSLDERKCRKKLNLPEDTTVILTGGFMYPKKGFEEILLAYSLIQKKKTLLVMFGQGPLLRTLRKTARKLKIEDNVRFTGYIPTDLMIAYFKACNFIVTINKPSNYVASSSILLNGVAAGKPIITNDEACNAEVVKDNVNGFLVSPVPTSLAKAMEILIAKEGLTKRMSESSRCMSGKMDWKEVNKITYGVYEDALLDHEERINDV